MVGIMNWYSDKSTKRRTISKAERVAVWDKYIGEDKREGKCYCCKKTTIDITHFEIGHNKALSQGGSNAIANYRPICSLCNKSMGQQSIETFKKKLNPTAKTVSEKPATRTKTVRATSAKANSIKRSSTKTSKAKRTTRKPKNGMFYTLGDLL